jgi:uncharacterized cupin superfamily protein
VNVNDDDGWEVFADRGDFRSRRRRLVGIAEHLGGSHRLGASVWEIPPGATQLAYHFHHVQEEFVVVLSGRPTLRTPAGERELEEGEVVFFSSGPQGAHQLFNRGQETVRVLFVSELADAEVAEYPDSGKVRVVTRGESQRGDRLQVNLRLDDGVDYFEGETPQTN